MRKDIVLKLWKVAQQRRTSISIAGTINDRTLSVINVYALSKKDTEQFLPAYTPATNSIQTRHFKTHHSMWYGDKSYNKALLCTNSRSADFLPDWTGGIGSTVQNAPSTFIHFSSNGNQASMIELTFTKGHVATITPGSYSDTGPGGDSDHALTTNSLLSKPPSFTTRRLHHNTDWTAFENHLRGLSVPTDAWSDRPRALAMVSALETRIQEAIDIAVSWSSPRVKSKLWWTPEISRGKEKLGTVQHSCRAHPHDPANIQARIQATNDWSEAIRTTQWAHWKQSCHHGNRATVGRALSAGDKARAPHGLPGIEGLGQLQGKCDVLRQAFFHANVVIPPPLPALWLHPRKQEISDA